MDDTIERAVLKLSLENLRTFPWIRDPEKSGHVTLTAWRFSIGTGELVDP